MLRTLIIRGKYKKYFPLLWTAKTNYPNGQKKKTFQPLVPVQLEALLLGQSRKTLLFKRRKTKSGLKHNVLRPPALIITVYHLPQEKCPQRQGAQIHGRQARLMGTNNTSPFPDLCRPSPVYHTASLCHPHWQARTATQTGTESEEASSK